MFKHTTQNKHKILLFTDNTDNNTLQSNDGNTVTVIAKAMGYSRKNANRGH